MGYNNFIYKITIDIEIIAHDIHIIALYKRYVPLKSLSILQIYLAP